MHTISSKTFSKINYIYNYDQLSLNANLIFIYSCPHLCNKSLVGNDISELQSL